MKAKTKAASKTMTLLMIPMPSMDGKLPNLVMMRTVMTPYQTILPSMVVMMRTAMTPYQTMMPSMVVMMRTVITTVTMVMIMETMVMTMETTVMIMETMVAKTKNLATTTVMPVTMALSSMIWKATMISRKAT